MRFICVTFLLLLLCFCYGYNCLEVVDDSSQKTVEKQSTEFEPNEEFVAFSPFMQLFSDGYFDDILGTVVQAVEHLDENMEEEPDMKTCRKQWLTFINDLQSQPYALRMADTWGRKQSGILDGNVQWMGNYYECIEAKGPDFNGKWCQAFMDHKHEPNMDQLSRPPSVGTCVPSGCSENSITKIFHEILSFKSNIKTGNTTLLNVQCPLTTEQLEWTTADTLAIAVTCMVIVLNLIATFVDFITRHNNAKDKKVSERTDNYDKKSQSTKSPRLLTKMVLCFSMISNGEKLLTTNYSGGSLGILNGIRFLSTAWVALGHVHIDGQKGTGNHVSSSRYLKSKFAFMPIINFYYSVDTFFFLGGLLVSYLGMKQLTKTNGRMNILLTYIHRFIRITPVYAYVMLFSMGILKWLGSGPQWSNFPLIPHDGCQDVWWTNLLYINNFFPPLNLCMAWCWYLAVDMQFYLLTPFILLATYRWPRVGISLMVFFTIASMAVCGILSALGPIQPFALIRTQTIGLLDSSSEILTYDMKFRYDIYYLPWARLHVYMIGMLTGYVLFATKGKLTIPKWLVVLGWLASAGSCFAIIFGLYPQTSTDTDLDTGLATIYNTFERPVYGLCLSWVIIACTSGYGGPVTKFLNWKIFNPLSRLTFSFYLIHLLVLMWFFLSRNNMIHCQTIDFIFIYIGTLLVSLILSFFVCLTIEWPTMELAKVLLPSKRGYPSDRDEKSDQKKLLKQQ
ncbi:nose resistant to fluoxetine protein 6-like [Clavelina lepadiformis]|uniref:nose resistant to fluoxetine protein 6-like n=1 Tax=Clavelina lepadiformis TaxID=159417 RepID=UPI0040427682